MKGIRQPQAFVPPLQVGEVLYALVERAYKSHWSAGSTACFPLSLAKAKPQPGFGVWPDDRRVPVQGYCGR